MCFKVKVCLETGQFSFSAIQGVLQAIQGELAAVGGVWAWGAARVGAVGGGGVFGGI